MTRKHPKIPFWIFLHGAHRILWRDRIALVRIAAPWFAGLIIIDAVLNWAYFPWSNMENVAYVWIDFLYIVVSMALQLAIFSIVSVRFHRYILLPDEETKLGPSSAPFNLVTAYFGRSLAIEMITFGLLALMFLPGWFTTIAVFGAATSCAGGDASSSGAWAMSDTIIAGAGALLFIAACYFPVRISLALPATAIGSPKRTFRDSWPATRGNFWRLLGGGVFSYWPVWLSMSLALASFSDESQTRFEFVAGLAVQLAAICFAVLIWVAYFSLAYRHLVGGPMSRAGTMSKPQ